MRVPFVLYRTARDARPDLCRGAPQPLRYIAHMRFLHPSGNVAPPTSTRLDRPSSRRRLWSLVRSRLRQCHVSRRRAPRVLEKLVFRFREVGMAEWEGCQTYVATVVGSILSLVYLLSSKGNRWRQVRIRVWAAPNETVIPDPTVPPRRARPDAHVDLPTRVSKRHRDSMEDVCTIPPLVVPPCHSCFCN